MVRRFEKRHSIGAYLLGRNAHRFCHHEIDGKLNDSEAMVLATNFSGDLDELFEAKMISSLGSKAKAIPGRTAVTPDDAAIDLLLQSRKGRRHDAKEL